MVLTGSVDKMMKGHRNFGDLGNVSPGDDLRHRLI